MANQCLRDSGLLGLGSELFKEMACFFSSFISLTLSAKCEVKFQIYPIFGSVMALTDYSWAWVKSPVWLLAKLLSQLSLMYNRAIICLHIPRNNHSTCVSESRLKSLEDANLCCRNSETESLLACPVSFSFSFFLIF